MGVLTMTILQLVLRTSRVGLFAIAAGIPSALADDVCPESAPPECKTLNRLAKEHAPLVLALHPYHRGEGVNSCSETVSKSFPGTGFLFHQGGHVLTARHVLQVEEGATRPFECGMAVQTVPENAISLAKRAAPLDMVEAHWAHSPRLDVGIVRLEVYPPNQWREGYLKLQEAASKGAAILLGSKLWAIVHDGPEKPIGNAARMTTSELESITPRVLSVSLRGTPCGVSRICQIDYFGVQGGHSGSPVVDDDGRVVGILVLSKNWAPGEVAGLLHIGAIREFLTSAVEGISKAPHATFPSSGASIEIMSGVAELFEWNPDDESWIERIAAGRTRDITTRTKRKEVDITTLVTAQCNQRQTCEFTCSPSLMTNPFGGAPQTPQLPSSLSNLDPLISKSPQLGCSIRYRCVSHSQSAEALISLAQEGEVIRLSCRPRAPQ